MKIFVCLKQVPDTETKIKVSADSSGIDQNGIKWVMNPYDEYAVEEAIKLRDAHPGSQAFALSLGPKTRVVESLRTALAMGLDEAIVIHCDHWLDNLATAKTLAKAIQAEGGADLVLSGKLAIDDNGASVPQMLAEFLQFSHSTVVSKLTVDGSQLLIERDIEGGAKELVALPLPAVIAANKGLNTPRYASLPGIMKAKKKVIKEIDVSALGISVTDCRTKLVRLCLPPEKPPVKLLTGEVKTQVGELVKLLRDEAKAL